MPRYGMPTLKQNKQVDNPVQIDRTSNCRRSNTLQKKVQVIKLEEQKIAKRLLIIWVNIKEQQLKKKKAIVAKHYVRKPKIAAKDWKIVASNIKLLKKGDDSDLNAVENQNSKTSPLRNKIYNKKGG